MVVDMHHSDTMCQSDVIKSCGAFITSIVKIKLLKRGNSYVRIYT